MRNVNLIVLALILLASFGTSEALAQCAGGSCAGGACAGGNCGDGANCDGGDCEGCPLQAQAKELAEQLHRGTWQGHIIDLDGNVLRIAFALDRRVVKIVNKDGEAVAEASIAGIGAGPGYILLQLAAGTGETATTAKLTLSWVKRDNGRQVLRGVLPTIGSVEGGVVILWNATHTGHESSATGSGTAGGCGNGCDSCDEGATATGDDR